MPTPATHTQYTAHTDSVTRPNISIRIWGETTELSTVLLQKLNSPPLMEHEASLQPTTASYSEPTQCVHTPTSLHPQLGPDKTVFAAECLRYTNGT
jgi:hypothetical protein